MSALTEILRGFRRNMLFVGGGFWVAEGCALATGANPVPGDLAGIAAGFTAAILAYPSVHEGILRHVARRPYHPPMTPEDYRRLREMEIELGWELSEPPPPAVGAPMTGPGGRWRPVSELAGDDDKAAGHFAALHPAGDCAHCGLPIRESHLFELRPRDLFATDRPLTILVHTGSGHERCAGRDTVAERTEPEGGRP